MGSKCKEHSQTMSAGGVHEGGGGAPPNFVPQLTQKTLPFPPRSPMRVHFSLFFPFPREDDAIM